MKVRISLILFTLFLTIGCVSHESGNESEHTSIQGNHQDHPANEQQDHLTNDLLVSHTNVDEDALSSLRGSESVTPLANDLPHAVPEDPATEISEPNTSSDHDETLSVNTLSIKPTMRIHYENKVALLIYHHLDEQESAVTITPDKFRRHLQALVDHDYQVISMELFIDFLEGEAEVPPNAVVLTFDDGYQSFYKHAFPILQQFDMVATNFLIVSNIGVHDTRPKALNWDEILEMHSHGFSFYSHTYDAHALKPIQANQIAVGAPLIHPLYIAAESRIETTAEYEQRVTRDLLLAEEILIEQLGNRYSLLCFPYGEYHGSLLELTYEAGIDYTFTTKEGINQNGAKELLRIHAGAPYLDGEDLLYQLKKHQ